jgi:phospholipase C
MALKDIDTFVIVMLENRSFDHACGYLSLPDAGPPMDVEGLRADQAWQDKYRNDDLDGTPVPIHRLDPKEQNFIDPPHEDSDIKTQIDTPTHGGASPILGGFVKSYANGIPAPKDRSPVMGYYGKEAVPVFDFFARNFAICDRWFSCLPAGTQPNRLMAMSGESDIIHNVGNPLKFPDQQLAYDWLTANIGEKGWCSYQYGGVPFFALMKRWYNNIAARCKDPGSGLFRQYSVFAEQCEGTDPLPDVIFIEPKYTDDPSLTGFKSNDDHCPTGISHGQKFLADIYNTLISNEQRWKSTALIVTYDEHGGFFDHVPPMTVPSLTIDGETFTTTGIRVPTFIVSPYVKPGVVYKDAADATSVLALLADRFTPGTAYSPVVATRQQAFKPLSRIFDNDPVTKQPEEIPAAVIEALVYTEPLAVLQGPPNATNQAFGQVGNALLAMRPEMFSLDGPSAMV